MFLRAGVASLVLLLASRLLGLARESAQAAAFGATGLGDVAVLLFSLPDWIASVAAGGALAYALLPAWATQAPAERAATQRRMAGLLLGGGAVLGIVMALAHAPLARWLVGGLPEGLQPMAAQAVLWAALAVPLALLAGLWVTRLQHEQDFMGLYAANLVVNVLLIAGLLVVWQAGLASSSPALLVLGAALLLAMAARLAWLAWRLRPHARFPAQGSGTLPPLPVWIWAALASGLPLALPFAARSVASHGGEGALAAFNYAWKLVELPLLLAIQLVAAIALPAIVRAIGPRGDGEGGQAARSAFALAWVLACAAAAGLVLASPAVAQLLFGWGRMQPEAIADIAAWGRIGAWSLLPQAIVAVGTAVLAARSRMRPAALAHAFALGVLLLAAALGVRSGAALMAWVTGLSVAVAFAVLRALGAAAFAWLPWRAFGAAFAALALAQVVQATGWMNGMGIAAQLAVALFAAALVVALGAFASPDLRVALKR